MADRVRPQESHFAEAARIAGFIYLLSQFVRDKGAELAFNTL